MSGQQRFGLCVSARHVVSCRSLTVPALSSTRIPTHVVICACEEALRGPESLPAYSCLLQINHNKINNSCNVFGARVLHFVLHFSPTYSCMRHDVAQSKAVVTARDKCVSPSIACYHLPPTHSLCCRWGNSQSGCQPELRANGGGRRARMLNQNFICCCYLSLCRLLLNTARFCHNLNGGGE